MVKIAILSHGLIHNTKVVLSLPKTVHLCTKYGFKNPVCQWTREFFLKIILVGEASPSLQPPSGVFRYPFS